MLVPCAVPAHCAATEAPVHTAGHVPTKVHQDTARHAPVHTARQSAVAAPVAAPVAACTAVVAACDAAAAAGTVAAVVAACDAVAAGVAACDAAAVVAACGAASEMVACAVPLGAAGAAALSPKPLHKPGCKPDNWLSNKASWLAEHWLTSPGAAASAWQLAGTGWQVPKLVAS